MLTAKYPFSIFTLASLCLSLPCRMFPLSFYHILLTISDYDGCRTDILILFLNQDPNLLRSYVVRQEGIPLLGLLVCSSPSLYLQTRSWKNLTVATQMINY